MATSRYHEFQTTNMHTFTAPQRMPGYGGYCPKVKYDYGTTYGDATAAFFHDYRQRHLSGWRGGDHRLMPFPAVYNDPSWIASTRDRSRARWLTGVNAYDLTVSGQPQTDVLRFDRKLQENREYYRDRSHTCQPVFPPVVPLTQIEHENAHRQWKAPTQSLFSSQNTDGRLGATDNPMPPLDFFHAPKPMRSSLSMSSRASARPKSGRIGSSSRPMSTKRQRAMRDNVFENRVGYE